MTLQERVQQYANQFSNNDWLIFQYLTNYSKPSQLTIQALAKECHVSTTTIFRFCQKLDFTGFSELKASMIYAQPDKKRLAREDFKKTYHQVVDYIDHYDTSRLFKAIKSSEKIFLLARSELELRLAKDMQRIFFPLGKVIVILPSNQSLIQHLDQMSSSVLVVVKIDSLAEFPLVLKNPQELKNIFVALLSDFKEVAILADERFYIPNLYDDSVMPIPHITSFTLAVEMLYLKLQLN
ncbi:MurR/RpiR family transcriptional regulator [Streptococcus thoraltensis]|uniref:MurR/RpiR family transcriptional regulator n=1 Tax=Streptococcus thoraltensis TaxID=55085 RepID=UPI0003600A53|nr:MurR/RpiR family transcriptional regulator [Streptococcus thoraltensis]